MGFQSGPRDGLFAFERERLRQLSEGMAHRAGLLVLGPVLVVCALALDPRGWLPVGVERQMWMAAVGVAGMLVSSAGLAPARSRIGRWIAALALTLFLGVAAFGMLNSAARAAGFLLVVATLLLRVAVRSNRLARVAEADEVGLGAHPRVWAAAADEASRGALLTWFVVGATNLAPGDEAHVASGIAFLVATAFTIAWAATTWRRMPVRDRRWLLVLVPLPVLALALAGEADRLLFVFAMQSVLAMALLRWFRTASDGLLTVVAEHPARLLVATFAVLSLFGGVALSLPSAGQHGAIAVPDAFFTAVSAACVSGFAVVDAGSQLSFGGQAVVLLLIQAGGLGIMTLSTGALMLVGRRLGMRQERALRGVIGDEGAGAYGAARAILRVTLVSEGIGAIALAGLFAWHGDAPAQAIWRGVFTSVSAFCGAGILLQPDSLVGFQQDPLVLHLVAALVVVGSLGAPVVLAFPDLFRGRPVSLQVRLIAVTSALLLVVPLPLFAAFEWSASLQGLSVADKLHNAWFHVVSPRSAGFVAVDPGSFTPAGALLTMVLMFIGGSPLSTAGGVKTTTVALLWLAVLAALQGRTKATAFSRAIAHESIYRAVAIMTLYTALGGVAVVGILLTQPRLGFLPAVFEVTSALGTVGMSLGATGSLDDVGKAILIVCMFIGRVGPLTMFLLLSERTRTLKWAFPEETVAVG